MKKILIAACIVAATLAAHAQRDTLIDHTDRWNLNTKFDLGASEIESDDVYFGGISVGGLLNDRIGVGIRGRINMNDIKGPLIGHVDTYDMWYGGLYLEYVSKADNLLYWSIDATLGTGEVNNDRVSGSFMVAEPGLNLWVNITETLMVGLGASYRFVEDLGNGQLDDEASGLTGNISLRFTQF
jgi:hypothetical protein